MSFIMFRPSQPVAEKDGAIHRDFFRWLSQLANNVASGGLTTAALSNHSHGNPTLALTNLTGTTASASNGFTLSLSGPAAGVGTNTAQTNVTWTVNSSGISLDAGAYLTTAALSGHSHGNPTLALTNLSGTTASASNGFTLSLSVPAGAGGTVSQWPMLPVGLESSSADSGSVTNGGGSSRTTASLYIGPMVVPANLSYNLVEMPASINASGDVTGSATGAHVIGIYSLNGNTALSLVSSYAFNFYLSQNRSTRQTWSWWWGSNSTSNSSSTSGAVSSLFNGGKRLYMYDGAASLPAGQYWVAHMITHRTGGANVGAMNTVSRMSASQTTMGRYFGDSVAGQTNPMFAHQGIFSTSDSHTASSYTMIMPASIATNAITNTGGSSQWQLPYVLMRST